MNILGMGRNHSFYLFFYISYFDRLKISLKRLMFSNNISYRYKNMNRIRFQKISLKKLISLRKLSPNNFADFDFGNIVSIWVKKVYEIYLIKTAFKVEQKYVHKNVLFNARIALCKYLFDTLEIGILYFKRLFLG